MGVEIYLYTSIYSYDAEKVISELEANKSKPVVMRMFSPGGNPMACQGICAKIKKHGNVEIAVDGYAASSAIFPLLFAKRAVCLETSKFLMHRADMYISNPEDQKFLDDINADYKQMFITKFGETKFREITGYTIDELFDPTKRLDININAAQAKELGLVQETIPMTVELIEAHSKRFFSLAAHAPESKPIHINTTMTREQLKKEHPALYAEVIAAGAAQEKDRVESILAFHELDPAECKKLIAEGKDLTAKQISEFALKAASASTLAAVKEESPGSVKTEEEKLEAKKTAEVEAFGKNLDKLLNIKRQAA